MCDSLKMRMRVSILHHHLNQDEKVVADCHLSSGWDDVNSQTVVLALLFVSFFVCDLDISRNFASVETVDCHGDGVIEDSPLQSIEILHSK